MPILVEVDTPEGLAELEFPDDMGEDEITTQVSSYLGGFSQKNFMSDITVDNSDIDDHDNSLNNMMESNVNRDKFASFIKPMIAAEGGAKYTNDPADSGGPTKFGITLNTLKSYRGTDVTEDDVKNLDESEAIDIYHNQYYVSSKLGLLADDRVQEAVLDHGITAGMPVGIRLLQRAVGVEPDGRMGPKTAKAVEEYLANRGTEDLLNRFSEYRRQYYKRVADRRPKDKRFLRGWLNRVDHTLERLVTNSGNPNNVG